MNNQCFIDVDTFDIGVCDLHRERIVTARKEHACCECKGIIKPNEKYEYVFMISEGEPYVAKTCLPCKELRDVFFCDGFYYESLWTELRYQELDYGGIPMCSFNGFSQGAIEKLSEFFDELNEIEEGE